MLCQNFKLFKNFVPSERGSKVKRLNKSSSQIGDHTLKPHFSDKFDPNKPPRESFCSQNLEISSNHRDVVKSIGSHQINTLILYDIKITIKKNKNIFHRGLSLIVADFCKKNSKDVTFMIKACTIRKKCTVIWGKILVMYPCYLYYISYQYFLFACNWVGE